MRDSQAEEPDAHALSLVQLWALGPLQHGSAVTAQPERIRGHLMLTHCSADA